jgi:hypothetical protein
MLYIMSRMAEQKTDPNIKLIGQVAVTSILWAGTFVATKSESFAHPGSLAMRVALVVVGVGGFLPVLFVYAKSIRMQDEFNQRIHYIALSIAFAVVAALSYTSDLLHQAGLIPQIPSTGLWALMVPIWFVSMIVTPRFYR